MSAEQLRQDRASVAEVEGAVKRFVFALGYGIPSAIRDARNDVIVALDKAVRRAEEVRAEENDPRRQHEPGRDERRQPPPGARRVKPL